MASTSIIRHVIATRSDPELFAEQRFLVSFIWPKVTALVLVEVAALTALAIGHSTTFLFAATAAALILVVVGFANGQLQTLRYAYASRRWSRDTDPPYSGP